MKRLHLRFRLRFRLHLRLRRFCWSCPSANCCCCDRWFRRHRRRQHPQHPRRSSRDWGADWWCCCCWWCCLHHVNWYCCCGCLRFCRFRRFEAGNRSGNSRLKESWILIKLLISCCLDTKLKVWFLSSSISILCTIQYQKTKSLSWSFWAAAPKGKFLLHPLLHLSLLGSNPHPLTYKGKIETCSHSSSSSPPSDPSFGTQIPASKLKSPPQGSIPSRKA